MPATAYERVVYKSPSEHHYMKVRLEFQEHGVGLNAAQFKQLLVSALKDLFGEVGAALPVDVLTYDEKTLSAILRICSRCLPFSLHYPVIAGNKYWLEYSYSSRNLHYIV
ncbi:ribonuclease P protein subunit p14 isoform X2 [Meriones unguiculatus]|uniref:ribonuclease P protein subunit p14 isoform X2 n=1 Tax=Meriones unguiculatus TaxID=10047 RepID=UPI000B4EBF2E|nr:ribonuclease P protein subunit p14 isoform X2 [Meriones unguiculatus]